MPKSPPSDQPEKKKRRQNVACDSCRLRRVKCDLLALLTPEQPVRAVPPLHVLVRENPDVACSNCISKGIRCTTTQIVNPAKPNKGGKRIEQAKRVFGSDGSALTPAAHSGSSGDQTPAGTAPAPVSVPNASLLHPTSMPSLTPAGTPSFAGGVGVDAGLINFFDPFEYPGTSPGLDTSMLGQTGARSWTAEWSSNAYCTPYGTPFAGGMYNAELGPDLPAWMITSPPASRDQLSSSLPTMPQPFRASSSSAPAAASMPAAVSAFHAYSPLLSTQTPVPDLINTSVGSSRSGSPPPHLQLASRKRSYEDAEDAIEIVRSTEDSPDPWGLWQPTPPRYTRREQVGEKLANRALGSELSRHLIRIYFSSVHLTLPAISPDAFYMDWQRAGERSDRMSPSQEVLCAVIEAWAARFSDHPVILGFDMNKAPKAILDRDGKLLDGSPGGKKRLPACVALVDRARKLMDHHGILRKPSVTGVQALALFTQLQHMTDAEIDTPETMMETEMIHTIVVEQMKRLEMMWLADGPVPISSADIAAERQEQIKQRRLFWTILVADSFWAAGTCSEPKISDGEIDIARAWLYPAEESVAPGTFKVLFFFISTFHRQADIARRIARQLSIPSRRPGRVDVDDFCQKTRMIWRDTHEMYRDINMRVPEVLPLCDEIQGFSPVHHLASLRQGGSYLVLLVEGLVQEKLNFHKRLHAAYATDQPPPQAAPEAARVQKLEELHSQSVDICLTMTRAQVPLFKTLVPTGLLKGGAMFIRVLLATAQFLCEIPTNEQGYPAETPGGVGWTWAEKQEKVGHCIEALEQLGWAWADVHDVLIVVRDKMATCAPSAEQLAEYTPPASQVAHRVAAQNARNHERDAEGLSAALRFWPPASVVDVIEAAIKERISHEEKRKCVDWPNATLEAMGSSAEATPSSGSGSHGESVAPSAHLLAPDRWEARVDVRTDHFRGTTMGSGLRASATASGPPPNPAPTAQRADSAYPASAYNFIFPQAGLQPEPAFNLSVLPPAPAPDLHTMMSAIPINVPRSRRPQPTVDTRVENTGQMAPPDTASREIAHMADLVAGGEMPLFDLAEGSGEFSGDLETLLESIIGSASSG